MIEVEDFFAENEILQQGGATLAGPQAVLVVRDSVPEIVGQVRNTIFMIGIGGNILVKFPSDAERGVR